MASQTPTIADRVLDVIQQHLGVTPARDNTLRQLGADSLDAIEIVMLIEEHFAIELTDAELEPFHAPAAPTQTTVADLIALVEGKVGQP